MDNLSRRIAFKLWPELETLILPRQLVGIGDVISSIYSTLIYSVGIIWLVKISDFQIIADEWPLLLLLIGLTYLFSLLKFFVIIEFREDRYGSADGALNSMMVWVSVFLLGPTALWAIVAERLIEFIATFPKDDRLSARWNHYRTMSLNLAGFTVPYLVGAAVFEALGEGFPITPLSIPVMLKGLLAVGANYLMFIGIWYPYYRYSLSIQVQLAGKSGTRPIFNFFLLAVSLPTIAHPFAILASGLYVQNGKGVFLFFIAGLIIVAFLTRQFSKIAESNRQQSRLLQKLELLSRSILNASPDGSDLTNILEQHIPNMFPSGSIAIWMIPGQTIYKAPEDWEINFGPIWDWAGEQSGAHAFLSSDKLPWAQNNRPHRPVVCGPIIAHEGTEVIGGILLELRQLAQPWDRPSMEKLFPALSSLADQIASAVHQAEEYAKVLAFQKVSQEIQLAGQIQASFLPNQFPNIPGWQLSVTLEPAGGLSGDFFDFIPLSRGRYGILIADVADKGIGAALYMALSRTLIRTYAFEYHSRPDIVFNETNERILDDARANLFITCFYGVLDPENGTLMYCNAGHNPPLLVSPENGRPPVFLERTGIPIGIERESRWERKTIELQPGDKLILYTDGITEAQNEEGEFYNEDLLTQNALSKINNSSYEMQDNILQSLHEFIGNSPQQDDITLMIISREMHNDA